MKSISLDSPESSSDTTNSSGIHMRPTGSGPTLTTVGKTDGGGRRYGGLLNVIRTRVAAGTLNQITSPSSSSTNGSSGGPNRRMPPPSSVDTGANSAPASYNQCKKAFSLTLFHTSLCKPQQGQMHSSNTIFQLTILICTLWMLKIYS